MAVSFPFATNQVGHIAELQTEPLGVDDKAFDVIVEDSAARGGSDGAPRGDGCADARLDLEEAALDERRDDLLRRVRVDLQLLAEDPHGRKAVARLQLTGHDRFGDREDDLIVERASRSHSDAERKQHVCTSYCSTDALAAREWSRPRGFCGAGSIRPD
jgi:hypothetical protein